MELNDDEQRLMEGLHFGLTRLREENRPGPYLTVLCPKDVAVFRKLSRERCQTLDPSPMVLVSERTRMMVKAVSGGELVVLGVYAGVVVVCAPREACVSKGEAFS